MTTSTCQGSLARIRVVGPLTLRALSCSLNLVHHDCQLVSHLNSTFETDVQRRLLSLAFAKVSRTLYKIEPTSIVVHNILQTLAVFGSEDIPL